jgi:hypothetical protein
MNKLKIWFAAGTSMNFLFAAVANAASGTNAPPPIPVTTTDELLAVICNFIGYFFWAVIIISVIFVLVAAYDYVTAGEDTEKTSKARRTLTYAAVGIAVALLAFGVPNIVASIFPSAPNVAPGGMCGF